MMREKMTRRNFMVPLALTGLSLPFSKLAFHSDSFSGKRIGIIGLDTSHSVAFTKALNANSPNPIYDGYKIVAAYPHGSKDIISSSERIPGYTEEVKKMGVEIVDSIQDLLNKVDVVMLETNDGRLHLEQAIEVFKAGKITFIDKPMAASLKDAKSIFKEAKKYKVPIFSSSSLRYATGMQDIKDGKIGAITGADTYSPMKFEKTHPDLFWYGIHGVEMLFTVMGPDCISVQRTISEEQEVCTGIWSDGRIGTFRGIKSGKQDYGGTAFGKNGILHLGPYNGYDPLLVKIIEFFKTGIPPVEETETLAILAFMEAADTSKKLQGKRVELAKIKE
ncbi:MAG: Gfo/Idh/MocA family protein [Aquirufa sp.]